MTWYLWRAEILTQFYLVGELTMVLLVLGPPKGLKVKGLKASTNWALVLKDIISKTNSQL